jgi:hypothetical protein
VDDITVETVGASGTIALTCAKTVNALVDGLEGMRMDFSATKNVVLASTRELANSVVSLVSVPVTAVKAAKALGVGMGAGVRRNASAALKRFRAFAARRSQFQRLRRSGVNTSRLLRTGGTSAMTFGQAVLGVSDSLLLAQRRAAAACVVSSVAGGDLDLTLIFADEKGNAADPAFPAHTEPILYWAIAAWESWLNRGAMLRLVAEAKRALASAPNVWAAVRGPGAAFVATAARLGWTVHDAFSLTTDVGTALRLTSDPPARVRREVVAAVRRWRWRRVEDRNPSLAAAGSGDGAHLSPIVKLLGSRNNNTAWTPAHRGGLRSAVLNRQWPQVRLFRAGLAATPGCNFCELANIGADRIQQSRAAAGGVPVLEVLPVPDGTLLHRIARCPTLEAERMRRLPLLQLEALRHAHDVSQGGALVDLAWLTRALSPSLARSVPPPPARSSFVWVLHAPDEYDASHCTIYTDGSMIDGPPKYDGLCARLGWAFVLVSAAGVIVASANGVPPPFVRTVPAAEAWALAEASRSFGALPSYRVDCFGLVQAYRGGRKRATSAMRLDADSWSAIYSAWDESDAVDLAWMPAHTSEADVGVLALSNGDLLTTVDRMGNAEADRLAKLAARSMRVPDDIRSTIVRAAERVTVHATWVGVATAAAGEMPLLEGGAMARDSFPAPRRVRAPGAEPAPKLRRLAPPARPVELGGHAVRKRGERSACSQCLASSGDHRAFAAKRCRGSVVQLWAARAMADALTSIEDGGGHRRRLTAGVLWCDACGAFAEERARGLAHPCRLHPAEATAARRRDRLRRGQHPITGHVLGGETVVEPGSFLDATGANQVVHFGGRMPHCTPPSAPPSSRMAALAARVRARAAVVAAAAVRLPSAFVDE